jgi:hypothetical protein
MELQELAKRISYVNSKVKNINLGGCGIFALELYKILRFEFGMETEIVFTGCRSARSIDFEHIMIRYKDTWIDSKGLHRDGPKRTMDVHELTSLVEDKSRWNHAFHFYFENPYGVVMSNANHLVRQMRNYISNRVNY